jgi:glyoxylase-like metal-dependent hydrolase (beta-lactamase superfamily II)
MYDVEHVESHVYRLELQRPSGWPSPVSEPSNVYLLDGDAPALINAGHPSQFQYLSKAIRETGVDIPDIERILHTSWRIAILGGSKNFPDVDHFAFSPDMVQPRNFETRLDEERRAIRTFAERLLDDPEVPDGRYDPDSIERFVDDYYPAATDRLDIVPLRNGRTVRAGSSTFEVLDAPGPARGHACLFDRERGHLFSGDVSLRGLPDQLTGVRPYLNTLERLLDLEAETLFPNAGDVRDRAGFILRGSHRFLDNFLSNAPSAMYGEPTLVQFVKRDLGYLPETLPELVLRLRPYRVIMEELVRSRMIEAEGEGLDRRYGTDFEDPREDLRDW